MIGRAIAEISHRPLVGSCGVDKCGQREAGEVRLRVQHEWQAHTETAGPRAVRSHLDMRAGVSETQKEKRWLQGD